MEGDDEGIMLLCPFYTVTLDSHLGKISGILTIITIRISSKDKSNYYKWSFTVCDGCFDTLKSSKM